MEQTLFIIGIIAFIFAKISIYLNKKQKLDSKMAVSIWSCLGIAMAGALAWYVFNFMATNGISGGISLKHTIYICLAVLVLIFFSLSEIKKDSKKVYASILDWAETIYFAAFFAAFVMFFFVQAFKIPSASMRNTLLEGDNLFVNKMTYGFRLPFMKDKLVEFKPIKRGDVVIFKFPAENKQQINCGESQYGRDFVKRVIGLPGEKVEVRNKQIYINDELLPPADYELYDDHLRKEEKLKISQEGYQALWEARILEHTLGLYLRDYFGPVIVPNGQYLVIGDNRDFSCDSRFWGPVPKENIKGKAWFLHWPLKRMKLIK